MTYTEAVNKALDGEALGFDFLYNSTKNNKYYLALKYVKNEETAKDVLQDAYIRAWKNLDKLKEPEKFDSWLSQIVVNTAKNELEKRNHTPLDLRVETGEEEDNTEIFDRAISSWENVPELEYTKEETRQLVHELIDSLSDEQRLVVIAFELEGLTTKEIAEQLGCSEATVKSRLRYGRNNIKEKAEELQKKGYKLYGIAPVVLLLYLLQKDSTVYAAEPAVKATLSECGKNVLKNAHHLARGANSVDSASANAASKIRFLSTTAGKAVTGIVITATVAGSVAGIYMINSNKNSDVTVVEQTLEQERNADTDEQIPEQEQKENSKAYEDTLEQEQEENSEAYEDTLEQEDMESSEVVETSVSDGGDPYFNYEERFDLGDPDSYGVSGDYNSVDLKHVANFTGEKIEEVNEEMEVNSVTGYIMLNIILYKESAARAAEFPSNGNEYTLSPKDYYEIPNGTIANVHSSITIPAEHILGVQAYGYTVTVYEVTIEGVTGVVLQKAFNASPTDVNPASE